MTWQDQAACKGKHSIFFDPDQEIEAKSICIFECPVIKECYKYATTADELVLGGTSQEDRIRKRPPEKVWEMHERLVHSSRSLNQYRNSMRQAKISLKPANNDSQQRRRYLERPLCPHCGTRDNVRRTKVVKDGIRWWECCGRAFFVDQSLTSSTDQHSQTRLSQ